MFEENYNAFFDDFGEELYIKNGDEIEPTIGIIQWVSGGEDEENNILYNLLEVVLNINNVSEINLFKTKLIYNGKEWLFIRLKQSAPPINHYICRAAKGVKG